VTEGVKAIDACHLDTESPKQWPELSFEQQVLVPRRSVASGEERAIAHVFQESKAGSPRVSSRTHE